MKQPTLRSLVFGILVPLAAAAQGDVPPPDAPPMIAPESTVVAETPVVGPEVATVPDTIPVTSATNALPTPTPAIKAAPATKPVGKGDILLNFQNAALADVLSYLSEMAGFVIVQEAPVAGTVNIVSKQPITAEDAVDLVNSVLIEKGYTAIRNGRILKIVSRIGAQKQDIPVMTGSDPTQIPRKDGMVTQILPVRYVEAGKLVENLRPLLSVEATISANDASNAILLADTQTNIHRIAEIIHALDTSVSSISAIRVFELKYADSKSLAAVLSQLFSTDQNTRGNNAGGNAGGRGGNIPPWAAAMAGRGGGGGNNATTQSAAQQAATRVVVVADEQSNSVIVSAPEAAMTTINEIINRIDTNIADVTETQIFRLQHADSVELANVLNALYADTGSTSSTSANGNRRPQQQQTTTAQTSARALLQARVVAVADPRTNSVIISAARETMMQIAQTVGRLDSGDSKKQQVFIFPLENADPDNVATILRGMFSSQGSSSSTATQPTSSRLNQRSASGASSDITDILNTNTSSSRR